MKSRRSENAGSGKLLDAWTPPEDAGEAIGCVATTFTFRADFFEEECLGRFLRLETDAAEDGPAYLIEREEKLAQLGCAVVLVDQHHARQLIRSLRWDVLVARPDQGIMHAKISLLRWERRIRLIVASANLTEDGYRRNLETFAVLDYYEGGETPLDVLDSFVDFLRDAATTAENEGAAFGRWTRFLSAINKQTQTWGRSLPPRGAGVVRVFPVLSGPGRADVFETLTGIKTGTDAFTHAYVISPFFDPPEAPNEPAKTIWRLLKQRGAANVQYHVPVKEVPGEHAVQVHAPESLLTARPFDTSIHKLEIEAARPLHAKCLSFENDRSVLRVIGSSNFTSAGLGLGRIKNWEANLAWLVHRETNPAAVRSLDNAWPVYTDIPDDTLVHYLPSKNKDEAESDTVLLTRAFGEALFAHPPSGPEIRLHFRDKPPVGWHLAVEKENTPFICEVDWVKDGQPDTFTIPWPRDRPPSGFSVSWKGVIGTAWWPVNALDAAALPPPLELKDLTLDVLIHLLTSARPLHIVLASWLRRQRENAEAGIGADAMLDPHRRVNTSAFLLQRTRRVSAALHGLRQRLERPFASEATLHWRTRGPVGVMAVAEAIAREAASDTERAFLLLELCLELRRTRPEESPGSLPVRRVRAELLKVIAELRERISAEALENNPALASYARAALNEVST